MTPLTISNNQIALPQTLAVPDVPDNQKRILEKNSSLLSAQISVPIFAYSLIVLITQNFLQSPKPTRLLLHDGKFYLTQISFR
jgi:hypothetical protein